jgi:hypothetical protein
VPDHTSTGVFLLSGIEGDLFIKTCGVSSFSPKTLAHTRVGQHASSLRDDGSVHALSHTVLLWSVRYGVMSDNAFLPAIIIENIRTEL